MKYSFMYNYNILVLVGCLPLDSPGLACPIYMYTNNATEMLASAYPQLIRNIISTLANACNVKHMSYTYSK